MAEKKKLIRSTFNNKGLGLFPLEMILIYPILQVKSLSLRDYACALSIDQASLSLEKARHNIH
ncbi:hypothetical protein [Aureitalea marina]|uniref:hypothetical protein n=1 Tax=Aureitalea marina TaxID=930804 RepID=UPI0011AFF8F3|nr:hypothetical protein [Aureitalea marina]